MLYFVYFIHIRKSSTTELSLLNHFRVQKQPPERANVSATLLSAVL